MKQHATIALDPSDEDGAKWGSETSPVQAAAWTDELARRVEQRFGELVTVRIGAGPWTFSDPDLESDIRSMIASEVLAIIERSTQ